MILYSLIARSNDGIVLAEATSAGVEGNHPQVTQQLIQALIGNPLLVAKGNRKTFAHSAFSDERYLADDNDDYDGRAFWGRRDKSNRSKTSDSLETFFHVQRGESIYLICLSDDRDSRKQRG